MGILSVTLINKRSNQEGDARMIASCCDGCGTQYLLDAESAEFHGRVQQYYLAVHGDRVRHLDGCLPPDRLLHAAWAAIVTLDPERFGSGQG